MEKFEFKKIKKMIDANTCLTSFIKKMNEFITKYEEGKTTFLKMVLEEFYNFREDLKDTHV